MRQLSIWILLSSLLSACSQTVTLREKPDAAARTASLQGRWELREVQGGMRPAGEGPNVAPGNGSIWAFTDSTYEQYFKGQRVAAGPYTLTRDSAQATGRLMDALVFPANGHHKIHFEITKDTLVLYNGIIAADGTIEKYVVVSKE